MCQKVLSCQCVSQKYLLNIIDILGFWKVQWISLNSFEEVLIFCESFVLIQVCKNRFANLHSHEKIKSKVCASGAFERNDSTCR